MDYNKTKENKESFEKFVSAYSNYKDKISDIPNIQSKSDLEKYKDVIVPVF